MSNAEPTENNYYTHQRPELVAEVDRSARRVLDIGCGAGAISAAIRRDRQAAEIWGVELVPEVAQQAAANPALDKVLSGSIETLVHELPDAGFSHIVAGDVLEHLVDPWAVLALLRDKLEPGGKFICSVPNIRNFSTFAHLFVRGRFEYKDAGVMDRTHLRFFARKDVRIMFEEAGYERITIGPVRAKKGVLKKISRTLLGDLVLKGFLVTAHAPNATE